MIQQQPDIGGHFLFFFIIVCMFLADVNVLEYFGAYPENIRHINKWHIK